MIARLIIPITTTTRTINQLVSPDGFKCCNAAQALTAGIYGIVVTRVWRSSSSMADSILAIRILSALTQSVLDQCNTRSPCGHGATTGHPQFSQMAATPASIVIVCPGGSIRLIRAIWRSLSLSFSRSIASVIVSHLREQLPPAGKSHPAAWSRGSFIYSFLYWLPAHRDGWPRGWVKGLPGA